MKTKKKVIRLTESDLHRIIAKSVKNVLNESHVIDKQFGVGDAGSFENAIVDAWKLADNSNKQRLQDAFPDIFPQEAMFGNENEPFDFRKFPTKKHYDEFYQGWRQRNH